MQVLLLVLDLYVMTPLPMMLTPLVTQTPLHCQQNVILIQVCFLVLALFSVLPLIARGKQAADSPPSYHAILSVLLHFCPVSGSSSTLRHLSALFPLTCPSVVPCLGDTKEATCLTSTTDALSLFPFGVAENAEAGMTVHSQS